MDYKFDPFSQKYLEYDDDPETQKKIQKNFKSAGILELLNELDNAENNPVEDKETQSATIIAFKRLIAIKLDLFDNEHGHLLVDTLPGYVEENERNIEKLEKKFMAHRHNTDKHYSEKPSW